MHRSWTEANVWVEWDTLISGFFWNSCAVVGYFNTARQTTMVSFEDPGNGPDDLVMVGTYHSPTANIPDNQKRLIGL